MTRKIERLKEQIKKGQMLCNKDTIDKEISDFIEQTEYQYESDIPSLLTGSSKYKAMLRRTGPSIIIDYKGDLALVLKKLQWFEDKLIDKADKVEKDRQERIEIAKSSKTSMSTIVTNSISVDISLSSVIEQISDVPKEEFSDIDKKELYEYLCSLEGAKSTKDKKTIIDKVKPVLSFLAIKGTESVISIALPLIMKSLL